MKYRLAQGTGDSIAVPQIIFSKLGTPGARDDGRFRVALYMVARGEAEAAEIGRELAMSPQKVKSAIDYWEGAGLLCQAQEETNGLEFSPYARKRLTTGEVVSLGKTDKTPALLMREIQRLFGGIVSQSDINIFMTLYSVDKIPAEVILMAASHCAERGKTSARYIEKLLLTWRKEGVSDQKTADAHLKLLAEREKREGEVAAQFGLPVAALSLPERKKIHKWAEEYGYTAQIIAAARLAAGEHSGEIRYVDKILAKWAAKGYQSARDVQLGEAGGNIRVQGPAGHAPAGAGGLGAGVEYVPMKRKGE